MRLKRRIETLERDYFPRANRVYLTLSEGDFLISFEERYLNSGESPPRYLRYIYDELRATWDRTVGSRTL